MRVYLFPFQEVKEKSNIIIWGIGAVGKEYIAQLKASNYCNVICIVDKSSGLKEYEGMSIKRPEELETELFFCDKFVISIVNEESAKEIKEFLLERGVVENNIIHKHIVFRLVDECVNDALEDEKNDFFKSPYFKLQEMMQKRYASVIELPQFIQNKEREKEYNFLRKRFSERRLYPNSLDGVRLLFFWQNLEKILSTVEGDVAELGVYLGDTACVLAEFCKRYSRRLYLFDTFEGFHSDDLKDIDTDKSKISFSDTSLEEVKERIGLEEVTHYKVGYFPETFDEEAANTKYAFVHIDCDLYKPIKAGLVLFSRYLCDGGMIVVHDYASGFWEGATQAVDEFCEEFSFIKILVPDMSGSVVLVRR